VPTTTLYIGQKYCLYMNTIAESFDMLNMFLNKFNLFTFDYQPEFLYLNMKKKSIKVSKDGDMKWLRAENIDCFKEKNVLFLILLNLNVINCFFYKPENTQFTKFL